MIIQLEGPDGSGKSTLATLIANKLAKNNIPFWHDAVESIIPTKPSADNRLDKLILFKKMAKMAKDKIVYILDRGVISDIIYRIFDSYNAVASLPEVIDFYKKNNRRSFIVFCGTHLAEQKMLERGEDNPTSLNKHKELTKVYNLVEDCFKDKILMNIEHFDYSKNRPNHIIDSIIYWANLVEEYNK